MADETEKPAAQAGSTRQDGDGPDAGAQAAGGQATGDPALAKAAAGVDAAPAAKDSPWSASQATATATPAAAIPPSPAAARPAPPPRPSTGKRLLIAVAVLALIGAGGYVTRASWLPMLGLDRPPHAAQPATPVTPGTTATAPGVATPPPPSAVAPVAAEPSPQLVAEQERLASEIASLGDRLTTLETTLDNMATNLEALTTQQTKGLVTAITANDERISRLERSAIQTSALEGQVRELSSKALSLREGFASLNAAVLGVSLLADAVGAGAPYVRQLAGVRSVAAGDPAMAEALAQLEPHATTGIATVPALAARFPAVADAIARAAPTTGGATWMDRVVDKAASLVTIRATGQAAARAGGIDAILVEAETTLAGGDLAAAVAIVSRIEGPAAVPAEAWLQEARLRLAADRSIAILQEQAAARLAAARG